MSEIKKWLSRLEVKPFNTCDEIETAMQAEIDELRAFIGDLPEAQNELLKINKANMAEIARLKKLLGQALGALKDSVDTVRNEYETDWRHGIPTRKAQLDAMKECLDQHEAAIAAIEKEGIK